MNRLPIARAHDIADAGWMPFPGGELEAPRPRVLCPECRARVRRAAQGHALSARQTLCFQCYRADLDRERRIKAAGELDTASEARFQCALPFEPVNRSRLTQLRAERVSAQAAARTGAGLYVEKRHRAQIEARHTLARVLQGLRDRQMLKGAGGAAAPPAAAVGLRAGGLQLPESWLPFVAAQ